MQEQSVEPEKRKVNFSPSVQRYTIEEFPDEYARYIYARHMDSLGWQIACWIAVSIGLVIFFLGFSMHINGVPAGLRGSPNFPAIVIISGAVMILVGGRLRWMWNPKSAEEFFVDNFQIVGDDNTAFPGKVIVNYLGEGVFRLTEKPFVDDADGRSGSEN